MMIKIKKVIRTDQFLYGNYLRKQNSETKLMLLNTIGLLQKNNASVKFAKKHAC